ncbi:MAG: (2Fe-2S)-binding protein [Sphingomonas sp.]|nr:(2Fe-2S)-binding protein [Sphingomonas sp.]RZV49089.1 MAG: (2Fe-2S)-binding protein [Sphingomonadaceae bacterium]
MIICSCNVIREHDIRAAARRGCRDANAAYASMGCNFDCASCEDLAEFLVEDERENMITVDKSAA